MEAPAKASARFFQNAAHGDLKAFITAVCCRNAGGSYPAIMLVEAIMTHCSPNPHPIIQCHG